MRLLLAATLVFPTIALSQTDEMMAETKAQCAKEWPGDFAMQEYCMARQMKAFVEMHKIYEAERTEDEDLILYTCLEEWPLGTGHDWPMVQYCYERQNSARLRLEGN